MANAKTITGKLPKYAGATLSFTLQQRSDTIAPTSETIDSVAVDATGAFSFTAEVARGLFDVYPSDAHGTLGFAGSVNIPLDMPGTYRISAGTSPEANCIRDEMATIDAILNSGVSSVTVDGTTTNYDLASLRQRKRELQEKLNRLSNYERAKRPVVSSIYLGGF